MFLQDQACLLRKAPAGESHTLQAFFLRENGLQMVLSRKRTKTNSATADPDLFESGEINLERKGADKPAFLRDFHSAVRYSGIARHYPSLAAASRLSRFYERNLRHMEHFTFAWDLLHTALDAFSSKRQPGIILLKAYFLFAKNEGYPVKEEWIATLPGARRTGLAQLLQSPVEDCEEDASIIEGHIRSLEAYFLHHTDLILPDA